jgi:hypothetical protein
MNRFSTMMLALSLSLFPLACSKESKKEPETPSHLLPASGTEPSTGDAPPGMAPEGQESDTLAPGSQGPTGPATQESGMQPGESNIPADPSYPTAGGSGGSGGMGGTGGKGGSGPR